MWQKLTIRTGLWFLPVLARLTALFPRSANLIFLDAITKALGITGVAYKGSQGEFWGSPYDRHAIGAYIKNGDYSPELLAFITGKLSGGGTYVDIGANIGLLAVPIARKGIRCICFEPEPRNFELLNLNANGLNIEAHNVALYDRKSTLDFEMSPTNSGDHRIRSDSQEQELYGEANRKIISVPTERLDDLLDADTLQRPIVVKIDTQGAEAAIFRGGSKFLSQADTLIFEYSPYLSRRQNNNEAGLIAFLDHFSHAGVVMPGDDIALGPVCDAKAQMQQMSDTYPHLLYADVFATNEKGPPQ